jgi:hypothetical protein
MNENFTLDSRSNVLRWRGEPAGAKRRIKRPTIRAWGIGSSAHQGEAPGRLLAAGFGIDPLLRHAQFQVGDFDSHELDAL